MKRVIVSILLVLISYSPLAAQSYNSIPVSQSDLYDLLDYSRKSDLFVNGLSTRGGLGVLNAAKAWAWLAGSDELLPQHIQAVFPYVSGHRLQRRDGYSDPLDNGFQILQQVAVPR